MKAAALCKVYVKALQATNLLTESSEFGCKRMLRNITHYFPYLIWRGWFIQHFVPRARYWISSRKATHLCPEQALNL